MERFRRSEMLVGKDGMEKIKNARIAVFGVGGVGSYAAMALVRAGIHNIDIIDNDTVSITNINRQLIANVNTVGQKKVQVMKEMLHAVNEKARINAYDIFFDMETVGNFDFSSYDYVVDAIDTVTSKLLLIEKCKEAGVKIISSMGTGNKFDPTKLEISDISKTSVCPLARVMRYELKKRGINKLTVVYSKEIPRKPLFGEEGKRRSTPGSMSYVPSAAGLIIASKVINDTVGICDV